MDTYPDVPVVAYAEVRPLIRSGFLLLTSGSSPMSKLIQEATNSIYSHVGFILYNAGTDRYVIYESIETVGIWNVPFSHYVRNYRSTGVGYPGRVFLAEDARIANCSSQDMTILGQHAFDLCGRAYDTRELAGIAWRLMCARVGRPVPPRKYNDLYLCSEYAEESLGTIALTYPCQHAEIIAPGDFALAPTVKVLWEIEIAHTA